MLDTVGTEMQVTYGFFDADKRQKRAPFEAMCVSIIEDRRNPFRKCLHLVDSSGQEMTVPLSGARAWTPTAVSSHPDDVLPSFAANSIAIHSPVSDVTWLVAGPTAECKRTFFDALCSAGCILDDLTEHFALLPPDDALPKCLRLGRPKSSRTSPTADVLALKIASGKSKVKQLTNEVQFLLNLHHEGIVSAYGLYAVKSGGKMSLGMLLDFKEEGDLESRIPTDGFPEWMVRSLMAQTCDAMVYLHGLPLVHRDIKPSNVLCERAPDGSVKVVLADFGVAAYVMDSKRISKGCGTVGFIAPEVLQKDWETRASTETIASITKTDVYSFGMLMYTIVFGKNPFRDSGASNSASAMCRRNSRGLASSPDMDGRSDKLQSLLSGLCANDSSQRLSSSDALAHPWFSDHGVSCENGELKSRKLAWADFDGATSKFSKGSPVTMPLVAP
jgi:serine/threonine protein kinase